MSTLLLDMALERLRTPANCDDSPQRVTPVSNPSAPEPFADPYLGAAADFGGGKSVTMAVGGLPTTPPDLTVSLWVRIIALPSEVTLLTLGDPKTGGLVWTLAPGSAGNALLTLKTMPGGQTTLNPSELGLGVWRHVAMVRTGTHFNCCLAGRSFGAFDATGFALAGSQLTIGLAPTVPGGVQPRAAMQRLRVHAGVLTADDLVSLIAADITPRARFDEALPLNVRLLDSAGAPHLAITQDPEGDSLTLELQNVSTYRISLTSDENTDSKLVTIVPISTISLTFPAGALHPSLYLSGGTPIAVEESDIWSLATDLPAADGSVRLTLKSRITNLGIAPEMVRTITLRRVRAAAGEGTRPCRVLFAYSNLYSWNPLLPRNNTGQRDKLLQIVDHAGSRFLPLEARIAGQARLRTGDANARLELRVRNTATDRTVVFEPPAAPVGGAAGAKVTTSALIVELLAEPPNAASPGLAPPEDAMLQAGDAGGVHVAAPSTKWGVTPEAAEGPTPRWVIYPTNGEIALAGGEELVIPISGLVVSRQPGMAIMRVIYLGLPGFQYQDQTLRVEKSPLVFDDDGAVDVGHGMIVHGDVANVSVAVDTGEALTICGRESNNGSELIGLATAAGARKWHVNIFEPAGANPGGLNFAESGVADGRMFLAYGGNVGIGTYAPVSLLHINGAPGQSTELRLTSQPAATTKAATVCSMVLQADGGKESSIVSSETQMTVLTSHDFVAVSGASGGGLCVNTPTGVMGVLNWRNGSVQIDGSLTATTKNFSIDHPLRAGERLLHGSLEGPEAGVYYRGEGVLEGGTATVRLPDYFEALTRPEDRTVHLTAKGCEPFLLSYEDVIDGRFIVHGTKPGGRFSWEVRAVRADTPRLAVEPGRAGERAAP